MVNTYTQVKLFANKKAKKAKRTKDDPHIKHFPFFDGRNRNKACPYARYGCPEVSATNKHIVQCSFKKASQLSSSTVGQHQSTFNMDSSTFMSYKRSVSMYDQWISSNGHKEINAYKTLMLPPQNKKDRLLEIRQERRGVSDPDPMEIVYEDIVEEDPEFTSDLVFDKGGEETDSGDTPINQIPIGLELLEGGSFGTDVTVSEDFRKGFKNRHYNIKYPRELAFQVHLLSEIQSFTYVPLALYDRIMEVVLFHCCDKFFPQNKNGTNQ